MTGKPATSRALRWVVALTSTAYFMVVLDSVVVITALPRMHCDLHVGVSSLQWTLTAYGIAFAFAAGIITNAALGDRFGRRLVFSSGLALFTLASAACALAPNVSELILARTVRGLGAAAVLPLSLTILTTAFPREKRGMIVGVPEPMVALRLFASREFAAGNLTAFMMSGATFAAAFFLTQEFQLARGYSPLGTGLRLLPFFATPMIVSPLAGALSDRIGRRPIMVAGLALQALGFIWVAARASLATSWIELDVALLIAGIGISMALPTVPTAVLSAVVPEEMGKASGINFMAQRFGTVFAIAIASAVFAANGHLGSPAGVTAGFRPAVWACAAFAVLAALTAVGISPRRTAALAPLEAADLPVAAQTQPTTNDPPTKDTHHAEHPAPPIDRRAAGARAPARSHHDGDPAVVDGPPGRRRRQDRRAAVGLLR
jgi:MFS family permease